MSRVAEEDGGEQRAEREHGGDPPTPTQAGRTGGAFPDPRVAVGVVVGQIHPIEVGGLLVPAAAFVGAAFRAGAGARRNRPAADGALGGRVAWQGWGGA